MKSSIRISNGGNTIQATGSAAAALFAVLTEPIKQQSRHTHVNNGADDACKECGKDLRDEIHFRVGESANTELRRGANATEHEN
jgi:uncharacterized protein with LGFP repeats